METGPLTTEDIDRGWKDLTLEDLAGNTVTVRLTAPGWRKAREIGLAFDASQDSWTLIAPCLPETARQEKWMDRLTPESIGQLHTIAVAMLCGNGALKKNPVTPPAPEAATTTKAS